MTPDEIKGMAVKLLPMPDGLNSAEHWRTVSTPSAAFGRITYQPKDSE